MKPCFLIQWGAMFFIQNNKEKALMFMASNRFYILLIKGLPGIDTALTGRVCLKRCTNDNKPVIID